MTKMTKAMCLMAAIATIGCAGAGRKHDSDAAQLPYSTEDVEAWRKAFRLFLDSQGSVDNNDALIKTVPDARQLVALAPTSRARSLSMQAFCVTAVGAGDPEAWSLGCFDQGGPLEGVPVPSGRACLEGDLEKRLRAALEVGGAVETQDLNATMKILFRCHQQSGTVGELARSGSFAKGRYGLPLSMLAWSRARDLTLPTAEVVDRTANMMAITLKGMTARGK